jgi:DNA-binding NtrC family response regulator
MTERLRILIVDDEPEILGTLEEALTGLGYAVRAVASAREALARVEIELFDLALIDIHMPGMSGLELLRQLKQRDSALEVLMMTGDPTVESAVEAIKEGAFDYITKPLVLDELHHLINRALERRLLRSEVKTLRTQLGERLVLKELVGTSPAMERLRTTIETVAATDSPVLIEGESGTGKELVAAMVHRASRRAQGPFLPVNCAAVPTDLMESEFFGHVRGAFSGAHAERQGLFRAAQGGTLLLDEIGEIPPPLQAKLLRVLAEKQVRPVGSDRAQPVDVRVLAATNRSLQDAVEEGRFRQDLFYRLNVVRVVVPPLRERREDIPALITHFIRRFNRELQRNVTRLTPEAMSLLQAYDFPGNVRELENMIEAAFAYGAQDEIAAAHLPVSRRLPRPAPGPVPAPGASSLDDAERALILQALAQHDNDREKAARALGISPRTMYRRLSKYGLTRPARSAG